MTYAIIEVAGKQYRVREGERLLVDRLAAEDGSSFSPTVLLVGGNGEPALEPGSAVKAKVVGAVKGPKVRIGKYKKRTGYRRHTGFRASLTEIQIESIGGKPARSSAKAKAKVEKEKPAAPVETAEAQVTAAAETQAPEQAAEAVGVPAGYSDLTIAQLKEAVSGWNQEEIQAALEFEQAHAKRKGAVTVLESVLAREGGES